MDQCSNLSTSGCEECRMFSFTKEYGVYIAFKCKHSRHGNINSANPHFPYVGGCKLKEEK